MVLSIYDCKWRKFLRRVWLFKFIPFVDFVLAAGSLATGNACPSHKSMWGMHEGSDFDVIVGVRQGRIFTARAFCILAFDFFGWRRKAVHKFISYADAQVDKFDEPRNLKTYKLKNLQTSDKFCFNHFVTPAAYRLSDPHNDYWKKLYSSLVPVYGEPKAIQKFFDANAGWAGSRKIDIQDKRYLYKKRGLIARLREKLLGSSIGHWLEQRLKSLQIRRIEKGLKTDLGYKPRIIYNDNELEFHPDTKRTENFAGLR